MIHSEVATYARLAADSAFDVHGADGCPPDHAAAVLREILLDEGEEQKANRLHLIVRANHASQYFRLVYVRYYNKLAKEVVCH